MSKKQEQKQTNEPKEIHLKDYTPPTYLVPKIDLCFELEDENTLVHSRQLVVLNEKAKKSSGKLPAMVLNGEGPKLLKLSINGKRLHQDKGDYTLDERLLTIKKIPGKKFVLEMLVEINPLANKALEGLYKSQTIFCTQNEPEGMRRISYFVDRPDVMGKYTTRIIADKKKFPVLLSNGNEVASVELPGNRHSVTWQDPFPKPGYLFALVAGDLGVIRDTFVTVSGRKIDLRIYCDLGDEKRCYHAMESLKRSMKWDEESFGLEYDLDIYMIVAVSSFNMGAMENKGLNIFNSALVLANPETATDADYESIEAVVAHEYFHNWTGNRVTCRDWFQLTLKEGLTVFRDQEFSSDMGSRSVQRIGDVRTLRTHQFAEDAGPMAHPIRPESYIEINNFYTATVYNKGSEIIRMVETIIGKENFKRGISKYFELYDGRAVTTEDFIHAMELASGHDLTSFKRWYSRAHTPEIEVRYRYEENSERFILETKQLDLKKGMAPLTIPLKVGLISRESGRDLNDQKMPEVLLLDQEKNTFVYNDIKSAVVPSLNRSFSAPVKIFTNYSFDDLMFLMANDADDFNRWDAGQVLASVLLKEMHLQGKRDALPKFQDAFGKILHDSKIDLSFKAYALSLPSVSLVAEELNPYDYDGIFTVREELIYKLSHHFKADFFESYSQMEHKLKMRGGYAIDQQSIGARALKNMCLHYLVASGEQEMMALAYKQFASATNMTDKLSAMVELVQVESEYTQRALHEFAQAWQGDQLVMNKWLMAQASSKLKSTLSKVQALKSHPSFNIMVPNCVRALVRTFTYNVVRFHSIDGKGYEFVSDIVRELDRSNPQMAAGIVSAFNKWKQLDQLRQGLIKKHLLSLAKEKLSKNVFEIVHKAINY
ncbi:MAG: aminopeptidase N [Oligoflexia bacterium]|nr:aminopeptidase N [Oligoflexia bacterium]MBF0364862.1 aminopeptidase N [Oligoflexia bacterium]